MSKKINFGTINEKAMDSLSTYHKSYQTLRELRSEYKKDMDAFSIEESKILENRKNDLEAGLPTDEVIRKWSLEEVQTKIRARKVKLDKECEPFNKSKREALNLIDNELYNAYIVSMKKGSFSATGTTIVGNKIYNSSKSFTEMISNFLNDIGALGQDNATALNKFVQIMAVRTSGMIKCSKGDDYIKVKSSSQFKELFMLAFLQYTILEKGVITINDDYSLSMTKYED